MSQNLFAKMLNLIYRIPNSDCSKIQSQLFAFLDGDLSAVELAVVDRHLLRCESCRREMDECKRSLTALAAAITAIPSPGDLRPGFYAKLAQSRQRRSIPIGWRIAVPALAAAAALIVLVRPWHSMKPTIHPELAIPNPSDQANRRLAASQEHEIVRSPVSTPSFVKQDLHPTKQVALIDNIRQERRRSSQRRAAVRYARLSKRPVQPQRRIDVASAAGTTSYSTFSVQQSNNQITDKASQLSLDVKLQARTSSSPLASAALSEQSDVLSDRIIAKNATARVVVAGLVVMTELHISDENRDFMSSTHIRGEQNAHGKSESASVDDDNEAAPQPVELPSLP